MKRSRWLFLGVGAACMLVLVVSLGWYGWYSLTTSPLRQTLPWSASDVNDKYVDMFPDYSYFLKAKLPSVKEFNEYCAKQNLTPHTPQRVYSDDTTWLLWGSLEPESVAWWNPSPSLTGTYVSQSGHEWTLAKYENGCLYVHAFSH